jgi:hypothetical protein
MARRSMIEVVQDCVVSECGQFVDEVRCKYDRAFAFTEIMLTTHDS